MRTNDGRLAWAAGTCCSRPDPETYDVAWEQWRLDSLPLVLPSESQLR